MNNQGARCITANIECDMHMIQMEDSWITLNMALESLSCHGGVVFFMAGITSALLCLMIAWLQK